MKKRKASKIVFNERQSAYRRWKGKPSFEKHFFSVFSAFGFVLSLVLFNNSITGNVISEISQQTSNTLGVFFFIFGLFGLVLYLKK